MEILRPVELEWIEGCRNGDSRAQEKVYGAYAGRMFAVCFRYLRDRQVAEDVLVMAFTKAFQSIGQYRGEGSFEGWIRRIVVNQALMELRRNRTRFDQVELSVQDSDLCSWQEHGLELSDLLTLVASMPVGYRTVFNLYAVEGYSHQEIAAMLGIDEGTSKSQLSRARNYLKSRIQEEQKRFTDEK